MDEQNGNHVALSPKGVLIDNWMAQGMDSVWSNTLATIVVEWEGVD